MAQGANYNLIMSTNLTGLSTDSSGNLTTTGTISIPNGTVSLPGFTFTVSPSTGMYSSATNELAFAQNGVQALKFSGSQAALFGGNVTLPAGGTLQYGTTTKILAPADGTLQITKSDGTFPTVLLGQAGSATGIAIISSNGALTFQTGNGVSTTTLIASQHQCSGQLIGNTGNTTNAGLTLGTSTTGIRLDYSGTNGLYYVRSSNGGFGNGAIIGNQYSIAKVVNYTVVAADSGTHFTNTAASGAVQFTLPTPAANYCFKFTCEAAQVMTVVTPSGAIFGPGSLSGTTRTITGTTAANRYSSFEVIGSTDGTNYVMRCVSGTIT